MFKDIPGNIEFQIALNGKIVTKDGSECTLDINGGKVFINMFGKERYVDLVWLASIAHFEVKFPIEYEKNIWDISFVDTDTKFTKSVSSKMMVLKRPLCIYKKYRIIPCFTNYAISQTGEVLDILNKRTVSIKLNRTNGYPLVYIYNPDRNGFRYVLVHRLVALAWVSNNDYFERPIVNHINGNKKIFHYKNLEWASYVENNIHAVNNQLRTDNFDCKIYDTIDKKVYNFHSVSQACVYMGISRDGRRSRLAYKTKHRLIANRYEFKLKDDETPWFYENKELGTISGRYTLKVTMSDGATQEHPDLRTFKRLFKVWNVSNINDVVEKAERLYPDMKVEYIDNYILAPVEAYNLETNEIIETEGIRQLSKIIDITYSGIRTAIIAGETRIHKGYAFRYKNDKPWDTNFTEHKSISKCILARHKQTKEELTFKSLRETARYFNIDRSVILRVLKSGKHFRLWKLSETEL